jgi:hypothetical protein
MMEDFVPYYTDAQKDRLLRVAIAMRSCARAAMLWHDELERGRGGTRDLTRIRFYREQLFEAVREYKLAVTLLHPEDIAERLPEVPLVPGDDRR